MESMTPKTSLPEKTRLSSSSSLESDRVEEKLAMMIMTLEIPPGTVVTQSYLCDLLDCGRTPLREAIQRLAADGLLVALPKRGVSVAGLSVTDLREIEEALMVVEPLCIRLAAERMTAEELGKLDEIISKAEKALSEEDFLTAAVLDYDFHRVIAKAARNRHLAKAMNSVHLHGNRFACIAWKREGSAAPSWAEHREILEALRRGEPEEAERKSREHSLKAMDRIFGSLRSNLSANLTI
jgi:DNA-binding GntR family transcriptional regulator